MVNYEKIDLQAMQVSNDFDDVFESSEKFAVEEVEITSFDKTAVSRIVVDLLLTYAEVIEDDKLVIDMNVDMIKERVRRTKDKEKESIVDKFDNMTKDQRNIEKFLKDHRMGEWNIGMQKGLREYVGDNYDRERDEINKRLRKERQAGKKDFVSDLQLQIYMDESDSGGDDENEFLLRNLAEDDDNMSDDENITLNHDD
jgi:adenylate kinase family enzyme